LAKVEAERAAAAEAARAAAAAKAAAEKAAAEKAAAAAAQKEQVGRRGIRSHCSPLVQACYLGNVQIANMMGPGPLALFRTKGCFRRRPSAKPAPLNIPSLPCSEQR